MQRFILICILCCTQLVTIMAQTAHTELRSGDENFLNEEFTKAEMNYRNAVIEEPSSQAKFNLGNSLYEQGRFQEAAEEFQQAMNLSSDTMFRAKALFNKGNSLLMEEKLGESLEAYKKSLMLNPNDVDVKRNFMHALQQQQQQQQQQQEQQQQSEEENEENKEDQSSEDENQPPPPPNEDKQEENEQQDESEQDQPKESEEQEKPEEQEMTRAEAEQLLQIIDNTDDHVQKKLQKKNSGNNERAKKW